eukprot:CAMPEP_0113320790 /NCGR_PEP_ID=MMETSP0010_2-20120614/14493_1 /TAXON_ID=216773 ORGANISM="Corethron hystrix, Strain 308" /NCGR_SAMPLE_ID=MMETSP0010_2 /ASSEMBLY_ACC=CAM_ASM_000155 /LENGTH=324 /DNA_ID=CAMNT_0000178713 /DNA_START=74 /DNA_END=1045 /DNA_ORIENTATION=+ /assembly_acc=CAM_ASM_000155
MPRLLLLLLSVLAFFLPPSSSARPKILCLHGGGGNPSGFRATIASLAAALPAFDFVFARGGYPVADGKESYLWLPDPPGGKKEPTTDPAISDASVARLDALVAAEGPFFGILGFSQGAAYVPVYLSRVAAGTFGVAITFCGYLTTTHLGVLEKVMEEKPFGNVPAVVWMGKQDTVISNDMTRAMADTFADPLVIVRKGEGHVVPYGNDPTLDEIAEFVMEAYASRPPTPSKAPTVDKPTKKPTNKNPTNKPNKKPTNEKPTEKPVGCQKVFEKKTCNKTKGCSFYNIKDAGKKYKGCYDSMGAQECKEYAGKNKKTCKSYGCKW